jgi:hypothetical protein
MRTTLTVNDNIMQKLKEKAHKTGMPLKQVVNTALEIGLRNFNSQQSKKYKLKTFSLGAPLIADIDKALKIATKMEDDEIIRKLEVRK